MNDATCGVYVLCYIFIVLWYGDKIVGLRR